MTIQELYQNIDGDYEKACSVLKMDRLIDKYIRKLENDGVVDALIDAGKDMDPTQLFEAAHAVKGVCANLGLVKISEEASRITEEYRPGNSRTCSDDQVKEMLNNIGEMYKKTVEGIHLYEAEN
jgi:HPt (histidine-containing phosphotransfer) domain-containing protein